MGQKSIGELASHEHTRGSMEIAGTFFTYHYDTFGYTGAFDGVVENDAHPTFGGSGSSNRHVKISFNASKSWQGATSKVGSNERFNVMQPFFAYYAWIRIL